MIKDFGGKILRPNHEQGIPPRVLYLDTETEEAKDGGLSLHTMKLAVTNFCRYRKDATRRRESWFKWREGVNMWEYIDSICYPKTVLYVIAHNAFFDLQASGFFRYMATAGWSLVFFYEKNLTYVLIAEKGDASIKVVSSTNFYECGLAELGEMVGMPKLKVNFKRVSDKELYQYCKRDVEILRAGMERYFRFLVVNRMGKFSLTKASQAMHAYRHRFMSRKIVTHEDPMVTQLERDGYFGGRCECFEIGEIKNGPFVTLDVNSMYPFIMKTEPVPCKLIDYQINYPMELMKYALDKFAAIGRVRIRCDVPVYPIRRGGAVLHPVGSFEAVLCTPMLKEALRRGHLEEVMELALYKKDILFEEYVDYFFRILRRYKKASRRVEQYMVKKFLNALYGKFAQLVPVVEEDSECRAEDYLREEVLDTTTNQWETVTVMLNRRVITFGSVPAPSSFTAIAAHITSAAQLYLWKLIEPFWSEKILYVDTDSLKIRDSDVGLVDAVISRYKLGGLKVEDRSNRLQILAPKAYQSDGKRVIKGIPKRAEQVGPVSYKYNSFLKQVTHMRKKTSYGVLTRTVTRTLRGRYNKGVVQPTGRITPFVF